MKNTELRQLIDEMFKQVEYIDNLVNAFSSVSNLNRESLREYISEKKFLSGRNYCEVRDNRITELLFLEADEYLAKALCNLCLGCASMSQGYLSWGEVTVYYASFFAIHGLLRIQGKAIGTNYVLFPKSIRSPASITQHEYIVGQNIIIQGIHEDVWRKFYDTYSQNTDIDQAEYADAIFFASVQDLILEVERRNKFNYHIFEAFQEIFNTNELDRRSLFYLPSLDPAFLSSLTYYVGDRDRGYLAKAALRIRLLHDLLNMIAEGSNTLKSYFYERHRLRLAYLDAVLQTTDPIYRESIEGSYLVIP